MSACPLYYMLGRKLALAVHLILRVWTGRKVVNGLRFLCEVLHIFSKVAKEFPISFLTSWAAFGIDSLRRTIVSTL